MPVGVEIPSQDHRVARSAKMSCDDTHEKRLSVKERIKAMVLGPTQVGLKSSPQCIRGALDIRVGWAGPINARDQQAG